jgi:acetolactate synthase I/II/III large subunit
MVNNGDILLESFKKQGIEYIFCSPGTEWSPVWEGLVERWANGDRSLKYINCRHESLAVASAIGYSKASGKLPAVLLHTNVGTLNAAMAIRTAYWAQVPVLICSGDSISYGAHAESGQQWLNRLTDIGRPNQLVKNYVKWQNEILSPETMIDSVSRGCQIARSVPQGPSFLSIPWELMLEKNSSSNFGCVYKPTPSPSPVMEEVRGVAEHLINSKMPVIITENAGRDTEVISRLVALSELLSMPIIESVDPIYYNFPKNHPLHLGYNANEVLAEADTIFVIGCQTPWHTPSKYPINNAKVIFLDEHPIKERLPFWGYHSDITLSADIKTWLDDLLDILKIEISNKENIDNAVKERFNYWSKKHDQLTETLQKQAEAGENNNLISAKTFFYKTNKLLPKDCLFFSEATTHENLIRQYISNPQTYFKVQFGGLGLGLGTSSGYKLANPNAPVVLFVGDGAFNYNTVVAGLGLCQEYNLPIMVVVLNNGGYIAMKRGHSRIYPEGYSVKNNNFLGTNILGVDYCKIGEAFGAHTERISRVEEIETGMKRALEQLGNGKLVLVDAVID